MTLGCRNVAAMRASLRNIVMNSLLRAFSGRMRLIATTCSMPSDPSLEARKISAMPPEAMRSSNV